MACYTDVNRDTPGVSKSAKIYGMNMQEISEPVHHFDIEAMSVEVSIAGPDSAHNVDKTNMSNCEASYNVANDTMKTQSLYEKIHDKSDFLDVKNDSNYEEILLLECKVCKGVCLCGNANTVHIKRGTVNLSYYCVFCEKAFSVESDLTAHSKTHAENTPYHCKLCGEELASEDIY